MNIQIKPWIAARDGRRVDLMREQLLVNECSANNGDEAEKKRIGLSKPHYAP
jgi:hypothetical protein